jgi:putative oxidoreductase
MATHVHTHVHEHNGLERFAWAALRVMAGLMWSMHGMQKIFGMWGGPMGNGEGVPPFSWPFGIAGLIELVLGLLIAVGLFTRPAALVAAGQMAVAYWWQHVPQGGIMPIPNRGELAALYCFVFLFFAVFGPGKFSIDGLLKSRHAAERISDLPPGPAPERARDQIGA